MIVQGKPILGKCWWDYHIKYQKSDDIGRTANLLVKALIPISSQHTAEFAVLHLLKCYDVHVHDLRLLLSVFSLLILVLPSGPWGSWYPCLQTWHRWGSIKCWSYLFNLHIPSLTVTKPSLLAASINVANCSTVRSYPGANLSIDCIRSSGKDPKLVSIPSMNYNA
jgi:hypothetical protein